MAKKIKQQKPAQQPFRDYCDTWLNVYKKGAIRNRSYDIIESLLTLHIYPMLGDLQLGSIIKQDLQTLLDNKADTLSLNSLRQIHNILKGIFYYAYSNEDIANNLMSDVAFPHYKYSSNQESKIVVLTEEEQIRLYKAALKRHKNSKLYYRIGPAVILLLSTGMRIGELFALKCSNIDLEHKEIFIDSTVSRFINRNDDDKPRCIFEIHETKTKTGIRTIPLNLWAMHAVTLMQNEIFIENDRNLLFVNEKGKIYRRADFAKSFDRLLISANIEHKSLHSLRHTFTTQMLRENLDVASLSKILGHSSSSTTYSTYVHLLSNDKEDAILSLDM